MIERWDPYSFWFTVTTASISSPDQYYYVCYQCDGFTQLGKIAKTSIGNSYGYNILVASVPFLSSANNTILDNSDMIMQYSNDNRPAQVIADEIFQNYCVKGVLVVKRLVDASWNTVNNAFPYAAYAGTYYTVILWASKFFCEKESPTTPNFS